MRSRAFLASRFSVSSSNNCLTIRVVLSIALSGLASYDLNRLSFESFVNFQFPLCFDFDWSKRGHSQHSRVCEHSLEMKSCCCGWIVKQGHFDVWRGHGMHQRTVIHLKSHLGTHPWRGSGRLNDKMITGCTNQCTFKRHRKSKNVGVLMSNRQDHA